MSSLNTSPARLSADDRYELAARAQNQQRLNYPTHLIVVGSLLVFVSIVVVVIGWRVRSAAQSTRLKRSNEIVQIDQLINEIRSLETAQMADSTLDQHAPIPDMLSKLKRFAAQANLDKELGIPRNPTSKPEGNARKMTYPYTVIDPSLEHLLEWVNISMEQIPGLEVMDLEIKPAKLSWTMKVTLARYERIE